MVTGKPSTISRRMSTWPAWRAVSSSMWMRTQRMVTGSPNQAVPVSRRSSSAMTASAAARAVAVEVEDVLSRLIFAYPKVSIGIVVVERQRLGGAAEGVTEPAVLHGAQVLDQANQVAARGCQLPSKVRVRDTVELPEHRVSVPVECSDQALLLAADERYRCISARPRLVRP
ncbi:MAG: hypothetical protein AVDCRST_MAG75-2680 [uncultured Propionibacteriaceae bacterium]|uniref:Uncharacterized protein n=1 Tax=uncultured Propionibacteriaceae bacterium TaxID=257457 RepID=A0A6J4P9L3_9ACTN|nr:MAG: hypothetical protein AVDCRST_MAG75-2680 [uncultured Propionibacteriaceae bacterium]